jgi:hypothetical protein
MDTEDDYEDSALVRIMLRCAACAAHDYADSPLFNDKRDIEHIRAIVKAATHLNAIMQAAKEVT